MYSPNPIRNLRLTKFPIRIGGRCIRNAVYLFQEVGNLKIQYFKLRVLISPLKLGNRSPERNGDKK